LKSQNLTEAELEQKFFKVMGRSTIDKLKNLMIFKLSENTYEVYFKYIVEKQSRNNYVVTKKDSSLNKNFYTLKNALAWCYYDKTQKFYQANRVDQLDRILQSTIFETKLQEKSLKKSLDSELAMIKMTKLIENKLKHESVIRELSTYTLESMNYNLKQLEQAKSAVQDK